MNSEAHSTNPQEPTGTAETPPADPARSGFAEWLQHQGIVISSVVRGTLFVFYLFLAIVSFWLWMLAAIFNGIRAFSSAGARSLLVLADGVPRLPGDEDSGALEAVGNYYAAGGGEREQAYERWGDALQRRLYKLRRALLLFFTWKFSRKFTAFVMILLFVGVPALYVVPRPQYVIITDSNSLVENVIGNSVYLIHGVGLFDANTYEFRNREIWLYNKWSNQVVKNRLHEGRMYKVWVLGIRWYAPELYPNIVWVQEVNARGQVIPFSPPMVLPPATPTNQ